MKPTTRKPNSPRPPSTTTPVIEQFSLGGTTCEVIRVHMSEKEMISAKTMLARGANRADMRMKDGKFLRNHEHEIPPEYWKLTFIFPAWTSNTGDEEKDDGFVRVFERSSGWWCVTAHPNGVTWGANCVLVSYNAPRLPSGK